MRMRVKMRMRIRMGMIEFDEFESLDNSRMSDSSQDLCVLSTGLI
jgi:hypothetical protein